MKLFKLTVICGSILSLAGCLSAPTSPETTYKPAMSAAYVDLLIEKAKAEERARVMAELAEQNKDDKRFSDIKINQLESKIDQLEQPKQEAVDVAYTAPPVSTPSADENTSSDPLLEQWKNIYSQTDEQPSPVKQPEIARVENIEKVSPAIEKAQAVKVEEVAKTSVVPSNSEASDVKQETSYSSTTNKKSFDTVLRQCVAGQTIPDPYLGSLPEVLNSNVKAGDSIRLPTLCKWSRSPEVIRQLQIALSERGFLKPSPPYDLEVIDGIWGVNTLNSLINYQKSRGLAYGQLSIESLVDLGVIQYSDIVNRKGSSKLLKSEVPPDIGGVERAKQKTSSVPNQKEESKRSSYLAPEPAKVVVPEIKTVEPPKVIPKVEPKIEPKVVPEVKVKTTTEPSQNSTPNVKFETSETKHCYVNQVIPGDYKGRIPELVQNSKESKVGYVQELPTLCKKDRSTEIIKKLQRSLYGAGYLKGGVAAINGVWNKNTLNAVRAYQKANGLAYGQLSIEVLESLGVL